MPRKARIDYPGGVHHLIVRGIERKRIFQDDRDRNAFLDRLGFLLLESKMSCFAWALLPNHVHLLVLLAGLRKVPKLGLVVPS